MIARERYVDFHSPEVRARKRSWDSGRGRDSSAYDIMVGTTNEIDVWASRVKRTKTSLQGRSQSGSNHVPALLLDIPFQRLLVGPKFPFVFENITFVIL